MPSPYEYAVFSLEVYGESKDDPVLPPGRVPQGWQSSVTSTDLGFGGNGYFAKAYVKDSTKEFVIAHRGTLPDNVDNLLSDLKILLGYTPKIYTTQALPFVNAVKSLLESKGYSCSGITGHSLGATYASLTGFDSGLHPVVFELPTTDSYTPVDITIYDAAPNLINTIGKLGTGVNRLFPDYGDIIPLASTEIDFIRYAASTLQQHSMHNLLLQFNPSTGQPKLFAYVDQWPYGTDPTKYFEYTGYTDFSSYGLNPHYWNLVFKESWIPNFVEDYPLYEDYVDWMISKLDPKSAPMTGKILIGDGTGNSFWGGTVYVDLYTGGIGNDEYYLFGGNDRVTDSGGSNSYKLYTPFTGKTTVNDVTLSEGSFYLDNVLISGKAYGVTKYSTQNDGDAETIYAIIDEETSGVAIGRFLSSSFEISNTVSNLQNGNSIGFSNFSWGNLGIIQGGVSNTTFGETSIFIVDNTTMEEDIAYVISVASIGDYMYAVVQQESDKPYYFGIYNSESGTYKKFPIPLLFPAEFIYIDGNMITSSGDTFLFPVVYTLTPTGPNQILYQLFNSQGKQNCAFLSFQQYAQLNRVSTDSKGDFIFISQDITSDDGYIIDCGNVKPLYLYTVNAQNCEISRIELSISDKVITSVEESSSGYVYTTLSCGLAYKGGRIAYLNFFNNGKIVQTYKLGTSKDAPIIKINSNGFVAVGINDWSGEYLIGVYSQNSDIIPKKIGTQYDRSGCLDTTFDIAWLGDENIASIFVDYDPTTDSKKLVLNIYDNEVNFVKTIYSLNSAYDYSTANSVIIDYSLNRMRTFWFESIKYNENYFKTSTTPFHSKEGSVEVIIGNVESAKLDCSVSKAEKCIAIAQEGEKEVLVAGVSQDSSLFGSSLGSKIFKLVSGESSEKVGFSPDSLSSESVCSSMREKDRQKALKILPEEEFELPEHLRKIQEESSGGAQIFGMKYGDTLDLSNLPPEQYLIINENGMSYIGINNSCIRVSHDSDSIPFNLTMDSGGNIVPYSPFLPPPLPSPDPTPAGDSGLNGGEIAGIVLGVMALLGIGLYIFKYFGYFSNSMSLYGGEGYMRGTGDGSLTKATGSADFATPNYGATSSTGYDLTAVGVSEDQTDIS
jgi:hypothetical protein